MLPTQPSAPEFNLRSTAPDEAGFRPLKSRLQKQFRTGPLYTTLYLWCSLKYTLLYWEKKTSVFSTHSCYRVAHFFTFFTAVMHELQGSQAVGLKSKNPSCFVQCGKMFSRSDQSAIQSSKPFCSIHCSFCLNKASNKYSKNSIQLGLHFYNLNGGIWYKVWTARRYRPLQPIVDVH